MLREVRVMDLENKERDFLYAQTKYGVAFRRANVERGQKVYRLIWLLEKSGHHSLISKVLNEDGYPMANVDMAFTWPDAPSPPEPPTTVYDHDWYVRFVHGLTNENGDVGPAMGTGAYHGEGEGGPHSVWVRDPSIPSDICEGLGMLAGTFHHHFDQIFQLEIEGGEEPVPEGKFFEVLAERKVEILPPEGINENHISVKCAGEPNFYDTRVDLRVGVDWEKPDWVDPNPHYPKGLHHFNIPARYTPQPNEESRVFWVLIRHAGTEELMSEPMAFLFNTGEGRRYATRVEWREENGPPPPPTGLGDLFRSLSETHALIAEVFDELEAGL